MKSDWIVTTRQALPEFFRLVRRLEPTLQLADIRGIDPGWLQTRDVAAVLWDVDGTLMPHHSLEVAQPLRAAWSQLRAVPGLRHAILSNCSEERFVELGEIFPDVPVFKAYRGSGPVLLRRVERGTESWSDSHEGGRPLAGLHPLKKPSADYLRLVLEALGGVPPARAVMVGDQYFTDIAGANLAGSLSIKVRTWDRPSFPLPLRTFQRIESLLYRLVPPQGPGRNRASSPSPLPPQAD